MLSNLMKTYKTRTVRFPNDEVQRIDKFLMQNSFLDFSTLTRLAISSFLENPSLVIKPLLPVERKSKDSKVQRDGNHG